MRKLYTLLRYAWKAAIRFAASLSRQYSSWSICYSFFGLDTSSLRYLLAMLEPNVICQSTVRSISIWPLSDQTSKVWSTQPTYIQGSNTSNVNHSKMQYCVSYFMAFYIYNVKDGNFLSRDCQHLCFGSCSNNTAVETRTHKSFKSKRDSRQRVLVQ